MGEVGGKGREKSFGAFWWANREFECGSSAVGIHEGQCRSPADSALSEQEQSPSGAAALPTGVSFVRWRQVSLPVVCGLLLLLLLAWWLRSDQLLTVSFWFDEACSWRISQFKLPKLLTAVQHDAHPPLFYLLQKGWQFVWGTSVLAARSLSLCCGLAGVFAMMFLVTTEPEHDRRHKLGFNWLVWGAGFCIAWSPLQIALSQQARPYPLSVLLSLLAATFLCKALDHPDRLSYWLQFCVTGMLLSFTHYLALFVLPALFLFALVEISRDRQIQHQPLNRHRLLGIAGSMILLQLVWWGWIPIFQFQSARTLDQFWLPPLTVDRWKSIITEALTAQNLQMPGMRGWEVVEWIVIPLWIGLPVLAGFSGSRLGRLSAWGALGPLLGITLFSCWSRNIFEPRLLCAAQAFLSLALMIVISRLPSWRGRMVFLGIVGLSQLTLGREYSMERNWHAKHAGLHRAIDSLNEVRQADEPVIVSSPFLFPSIVTQSRFPEGIVVAYAGDHRHDVLAGPPLQPQDYEQVQEILKRRPPVIWTVDAEQFFGGSTSVSVPAEYRTDKQWRAAESFGIPLEVLLRRYRLPDSDP